MGSIALYSNPIQRLTMEEKTSKNNNKENEGENEVKQRITVTQTEIKKAIRGYAFVESVLHVEGNTNKQTVLREEHPSRFREAVENVQQASPLPKKDKKNDKKKNNGDGGRERKTKKDAIDKPKEKLEQKKSNELVQPQVATAMLKVHSHCDCIGCTKKIQKVVTKTIGYYQMAIHGANGQVTVKGSMDMNALAKSLERQLKRYVEIVPLSPPKEDEKKEKSGCDHKQKDGGERNIGGEGGLDGEEKAEKSYGDEFAKYVNGDTKKPTVIGKVNPAELRPTVDQKKCKKLQKVSPILPEEDENKKKENGGGGEERKEKKQEGKAKPNEKPEVTKSTKSNEPEMTTAVLEVDLYCNCIGCTQNIQKVVINTPGYHDMTIDDEKGLVTVTGSMDMKVLAYSLRQQLNKDVQILATEANGGSENEEENSGGEKKAGGESGGYGGENLDQYQFGESYRSPAHGYPTQIFSDENPNCSLM